MLEHFFVQPHVITRLRHGPLGPYLDDLATLLHHQGYARSSIQSYLRTGDTFGRWLHQSGYTVSTLDVAVFQRYATGLMRYRSGHLPKAAEGLNHLLRFLQHQGVVQPRSATHPAIPVDPWLAEYATYLDHVVGLAVGTQQGYLRLARRFLTACFGSAPPDWSALTASMITAFVCQEAARRQGAGRQGPAIAVRSLLRFLVFRGAIRPGLEAAAPIPPQWTHATLPMRLTPQEVEQLLTTSADDAARSRRNRAILLLLARLGLRAHEVVSLCLDDIDWADGRIGIRPGKTHQARSLPLSQEVGEALVTYLQSGRPSSDRRQVFLQCRPPFQALTHRAVWWVVRQAWQRAGLAPRPRTGSHLFRHTAASQMVNHGASCKDVADVLGHRSLQTTGIYAKLELETLAAVALPWLGGAPCPPMS
jgi:integrase/recombinase XerD